MAPRVSVTALVAASLAFALVLYGRRDVSVHQGAAALLGLVPIALGIGVIILLARRGRHRNRREGSWWGFAAIAACGCLWLIVVVLLTGGDY